MPLVTAEELQAVWRYARRDAADNFVFDVIDYEDVAWNLPHIVKKLEREIKGGQYTPTPLLSVDVPKRPYSVRPGAVISLTDLIVLYALVRRVAPALDAKLAPAVFSYRWLPEGKSPPRPLSLAADEDEYESDELLPKALSSPYPPFADLAPAGWFRGWLDYHERGKDLAAQYEYCAVGDVTAYFENVGVSSLFDRIDSLLEREYAPAAARLRRLYEFWGWQPAGATARGKVLPQGNDISLFLSNFFLTELDEAMAKSTGGDAGSYQRYVDDIRIFAHNLEEGRQTLLACDRALRDLSLSLNPEKTRVVPTARLFDAEIEAWIEAMSPPQADATAKAREFLEKHYDEEDPEKWERAYLRALTTLQRTEDDSAIPLALRVFLENPSYKLLVKNFDYLSYFAHRREFGTALAERLRREVFTFPYHKHFVYRLAAYGREDSPALREMALHEARQGETEWYVRMAALFCLNSFRLSSGELDEIKGLAERESHPVVARAAFVALRQRPIDEFTSAEDHVLLATTPGQTDLREYFFRLSTEEDLARSVIAKIRKTDVASRSFLNRLHQLDLVRSNVAVGDECRELLEKLSDLCLPSWPRLRSRLRRISELSAVGSLHRLKTRKIARAHQQLETVLHRSREAVIITDAHGAIQVWNEAASHLLGHTREETLGRNLASILEPAGGFACADELLTFLAESGGSFTEEAVPYRRCDGVSLTLSRTYSVITDTSGEATGLFVLIRDVTPEIRAAKAERFQAAAEKLLSETSARFVGSPELDGAITRTLAETSDLLAVKRAYVFRARDADVLLEITHEAGAPGVPSLRASGHKIELHRLPLLKYQLLGRYVAVADDAEALPPPEREELRRRGARASLGVPFHVGSQLAGFVGCDDTERTHAWEPDEINLLRSVTALISKAWEKKEAEEKLRHKSHELGKRVKELNCLVTISRSASAAEATQDVILQRAVEAVQRSWQYPEVTCARIVIDDREFSAGPRPLAEAVATQRAPIEVQGKPVGAVEVGYCEERPARDEGPFLHEERDLIDTVAQRLGETVEAKRAEDALRKSEREKTTILSSMAELVAYLDPDLNVLWANDAAAEWAGTSPRDMVGRRCYEVWYGRDERCAHCHVNQAIETGELQELETTYSDGSVWNVRCNPVRDEAGEIAGVVEVSLDITDQKRAEADLRNRAEDLRTVNDVASELAAAPSTADIYRTACDKLRALTGARAVVITGYETAERELRVRHISAPPGAIRKASNILGEAVYDVHTPVDDEMADVMLSSRAKTLEGLYELTSGTVPRPLGAAIEKALGIGGVYAAALRHGGELVGALSVLMPHGCGAPSFEVLENYANVTAAALKRKRAEEELARRVESLKIVNDMAIELAAAASPAEVYAVICTKLKDVTGALATITTSYDADADELALNYVVAESKVIKKGNKILGVDMTKLRFPAQGFEPDEMPPNRVVVLKGISEETYKVIPKKVCAVIEKVFNLGSIYELLLHHSGRMMGTAEAVMPRGSPAPSVDALETFAHVAAAALRNKRAEEARRESEERYSSLIATMNEGFGIQDADGIITYVNDRFCEMVGYAREELMGRPATAFLDKANAALMRAQTARREKTPGENYDIIWRAKDGGLVYTIFSPGVLHDRRGRYVGSYATVTDITDRKRDERVRSFLYGISEAAAASENLDQLIATTRELLGTLIDVTNFHLFLYDKERGSYTVPFYVDERDEIPARGFPRVRRGLTDYVRRTGRPLRIDDDLRRELVSRGEVEQVGPKARVWLGAPLRAGEHVIGVVSVQNYEDGEAYTDEDLELLHFVSDAIAAAVERKRAEEALRRRAEETAAVNELASRLTAAESTADLYRDIGEGLKRITGALAAAVASCGPSDDNFTVEYVAASPEVVAKITALLARDVRGARMPLDADRRDRLISGKITRVDGVPPYVADVISAEAARGLTDALAVGESYIAPLVHAGELTGVAVTVMGEGERPPLADTLEGIANAGAAALRRKKAEEELGTSEDKYRNLVEQSLQGVLIADHERVIFVNAAFAEIAGYPPDELIGLSPAQIVELTIHPDDRETVHERFAGRLRDVSIPERYEFRSLRQDGSLRWIEVHSGRITLAGRPAIQATFADVTDRKLYEEKLLAREQRFHTLFDDAPLGYKALDGKGRLVDVNGLWLETLGYAREEVIGRPFTDFLTSKHKKSFAKNFATLKETGEVRNMEFEMVRKNGSRILAVYDGRAVYDEEGGFLRSHCIVRNVTELQQAREALAEAEVKLNEILDLVTDGITFVNPEDVIVFASREFAASLGYEPDELKGIPFASLMAPRESEEGQNNTGPRRKRKSAEHEIVLLRRDGTPMRLDIYSKPLTTEAGAFLGTMKKIVNET